MFDVRCWRFPSTLNPQPSTTHVQRTPHSQPRLLHDVRINLGGADILVPEQILHRPNIIAIFQKMSGERVSQRVACRRLGKPRQPHRLLHHPLHTRVIQMMPLALAIRRINGNRCSRPDPLPAPFLLCVRILPRQRPRQRHRTQPIHQIPFMQQPHPFQMPLEFKLQLVRQHRHPVLFALAIPNHNLVPLKIHVLDSQPQTELRVDC